MLSHADLHPIPEAELPGSYRDQIARIVADQGEAARWDHEPGLRSKRFNGVLFVPRSASGLPPGTKRSVALVGIGLLVLVAAGLQSWGSGLVTIGLGVAGLAALVAGGLGLAQWNPRREVQAALPTRDGLYLFDDALVLLSPPAVVIHRPERCGAQLIPRGAVRGATLTAADGADGAPAFLVELEVRKTTGELVRHVLDAWPSPSRRHPLKDHIDAWLAE